MAITQPPQIGGMPTLPDPGDKETFSARKLANMQWVNNEHAPKSNQIGQITYGNALEAASAANAASSAKNDAVQAKNDAVTAKDQAVTARGEAVAAKNQAVDAKNAAELAAQSIPGGISTAIPKGGHATGVAGASGEVSDADHRHPHPSIDDIPTLKSEIFGPTSMTLARSGGVLTGANFTKDGKAGTLTLTYTDGVLTSVAETWNGKTVTTTLTRTSGLLTGVTVTES